MADGTYTMVYAESDNLYRQAEAQSRSKYNRVCIDGKVTGCGNCTGYCSYDGHPGFLTEKHQKSHRCVAKECRYFIPKPKRVHPIICACDLGSQLLAFAKPLVSHMEGLRILNAHNSGDHHWTLHYISISNDYSLSEITAQIEDSFDCKITFSQLNYSFEHCVQLILAG